MSTTSQDIESLKSRLKSTWSSGDFGQIARAYEAGAAEFVQRLNLTPGTRVLDVACGTGNLALPAARAGANVTGVDIAANLIEQARAAAEAEGLKVQFDEGDAEQLPYADRSFDVVISMFGVMFTPRPELAAAELVRVCRPGGRITLANWTATGFIGQMFKTIGAYVPPPSHIPSPLQWGDEQTVRDRLNAGVSELQMARRLISFSFPFGPAESVEHFRTYYGPTLRAFQALDNDPPKQQSLRAELEQLWSDNNQATDGTTLVESEYMDILAVRK